MTEEMVNVRVEFIGSDKKKFDVVKQHIGATQNTDVLRVLVSEKYNELVHEGKGDVQGVGRKSKKSSA